MEVILEMPILMITAVLYVIKVSFDRTNLSLFLLYFWLFLTYRTTVQPIQVIIISLIYYSSIAVIWILSYHTFVIYCWPVCLHWSDQYSLILKLFLGCDWNFSVGRIQAKHTYLLPPQVYGRSWWGFRLGVQTCLLQLIDCS